MTFALCNIVFVVVLDFDILPGFTSASRLEASIFVESGGTKAVLLEKVVENMLEEQLVKTALCLGDELAVFMVVETRERRCDLAVLPLFTNNFDNINPMTISPGSL